MQQFSNVPDGLEMVNLGSTFAKYGFDYGLLGRRGFNFAGQPQTLKEDHAILEQYADHIQKGAVVVLPVCLFGFAVYEYAAARPAPQSGGLGANVKKAVKALIGYDRAKRLKYEKMSPEEKADAAALGRVNAWKQEFSLPDTAQAEPSAEMLRIFAKTRNELTEMLRLCREKGFRPAVVNMPAAKAEYTLFSEPFVRKFYEENVEAANPFGVPVFRYFGDERFASPLLYENYADCLNDAGRKQFAEALIRDLQASGLWTL